MLAQPRHLSLLGAGGLVLLLLIAWREGLLHMINVWRISPAYMHGFIVPIVSAGLIYDGWRKGEVFTTWPLALVGVGGASALYALATVTDIQLGQHLAIAGGIASLLALVFGKAFAIRHRFALAFLFCAVPVGEEITPLLQEITAAAITGTLHVLDITAIKQGLMIRTEPGDFLVAEACAGLRFLVGMVVSGILFAHLLLRTRWKQLTLIAACFIVPVIANLIRAVSVVLIGVWSDMSLATGFDHLVYGWGLFALIFAALFFAALKASETGAPVRSSPPMARMEAPRPMIWLAAGGMIIVGGLF